jgi:hypothetical protein
MTLDLTSPDHKGEGEKVEDRRLKGKNITIFSSLSSAFSLQTSTFFNLRALL